MQFEKNWNANITKNYLYVLLQHTTLKLVAKNIKKLIEDKIYLIDKFYKKFKICAKYSCNWYEPSL